MTRALLIVDIQRDYFPGGAFPLVDPDAAARVAHTVLESFRAEAEPVVHIRHVSTGEGATFFLPGSAGAEIHELVAPAPGETVLEKHKPHLGFGRRIGARADEREGVAQGPDPRAGRRRRNTRLEFRERGQGILPSNQCIAQKDELVASKAATALQPCIDGRTNG